MLTEKATREDKAAVPAQGGNPTSPAVDKINIPTDLKFNVTDCKMYLPVVTLQAEYENKLYKELKTGITLMLRGINIDHKLLMNQQLII